MKERFEIVIAGAGMIGLTAGSLLAQAASRERFDITIVDAGPRPSFDPGADVGLRVSAVSLGSAAILGALGLWDSIASQRACAYRSMRVWDARSAVESPETLRFDAADFGVPELGFIVENALIRDELCRKAAASGIELRFDTGITRLDPNREGGGYKLELDTGRVLRPDLLIGADGPASLVRREAGVPTRSWPYPQSAFVTHVAPERSHRNTAWQRFLRNGPLALLPLADGRTSVVWSSTPSHVEQAMAASDAELGDMLTAASDSVLGRLQLAGPKGSFPLRAHHAVRYVAPGLALIGDAAHGVHPLAGQGANLGFADARALADALEYGLARNEYPGDLPTLRNYERARRGANVTMLRFIDSINRLFLGDSPALSLLRRRGMRLFNRSGPIRRRAVRVALGINV